MNDVGREAGPWLDSADDLSRLLWRQSGIITRSQALKHMSPKTVDHRIRSARWRRLHRGVFATQTGELTADQRLWAAVLAVGPHAVLAGPTAASRCGMRGHIVQASRRIHVLIPAAVRDRNPPPEVTLHRSRSLTPADLHLIGTPPHTTIVRSIVDAASWANTNDDAYGTIASAFQQRLLNATDVEATLRRLSHVRRRALIRQAAIDAAGGVHSVPERQLVRGIRADGLPLPTLQVKRRDSAGRTYYLDGFYEDWQLHIEVDGGQHTYWRSYWQDMRRQNAAWIAGDRVLRYPSMAVRYYLPQVVAEIRSALIKAGWRP
jgi:very-short-patch-repair endonuclease